MTKVYNRFQASQIEREVHFPGESATVQAARSECDINNVIERLSKGQDPGVTQHQGRYSDNAKHVDMKPNLDIIRRHQSAYNELPLEIRQRFKTPLEYYNAQQQDLEKSLETRDPLDVSGLTDSKAGSSTKKGDENETQTAFSESSKKGLQKGNRSSSGEHTDA